MRAIFSICLFFGMAMLTCACSKQTCDDCFTCQEKDVVEQTYVHKYGVPVPQKEWSSRGQNGQVVSTLKTGVVVTKNYSNGYLDGEATYTFPHSGAIERKEKYEQGHLVSEREYYHSGTPKKEVEYLTPSSTAISMWYENGSPRCREDYHENCLLEADYYTLNNQVESRVDNGEGKKVNRDEFGQLLSTDYYEHGMIALRSIFYPNGAPKEMIPFQHGQVNGRKTTFLPGGEPRTVEEWVKDRQEGITVVFQNGEKIAEVPYFKGMKNGIEERFNDGQFIVEEITWKDGHKHGPCYTYIGEDTHIAWFFGGREVTKQQYDRLLKPIAR